MSYQESILDILSTNPISTVYIGIGANMGHYDVLTQENNQQFPCFLNKLPDQYLVILIDPCMEQNLKLVEYFEQENDPLVQISQINWSENESGQASHFWDESVKNRYPNKTIPMMREYSNSRGHYFVINDCFYLDISEPNQYTTELKQEKTLESIGFIYQLITTIFENQRSIKMICQDYTGDDTTNFYTSLFSIFGRDLVTKNICFDVTQQTGGCFINFNSDMIRFDTNGDFIQEKYEKLENISDSPHYYEILKLRISFLIYPLSWNYMNLFKSEEFIECLSQSVRSHAEIYGIDFNMELSHNDLLLQYEQIIHVTIDDIIKSRNLDPDISKYLFENLHNRNDFINAVSILRFE